MKDKSNYSKSRDQHFIPIPTGGKMTSRWGIVLGLVLATYVSSSPLTVSDEDWETNRSTLRDVAYRLPTNTKPIHYNLTITPFFENVPTGVQPFTFDGEVTLTLTATVNAVTEIVMHCDDLTIESVSVTYMTTSNEVVPIHVNNVNYACEMPYAFLRIPLLQTLVINQEYTVNIVYRGNIQEGMRGFYRSWYYDSTGRKWMGTTQFQPGHARQAFPCYDEPSFKATFDITIVREEDFSPTISNMPIETTTNLTDIGRVAEKFYTTPITSTYLLAFIVSHYDQVETNDNPTRPFHIYARDNVGDTGNWALEIGEQMLEAMENYLDFPYYSMAENIDMKQAAIPDFSAGAMENWGLLTYREALVLYDPLHSNHFYLQRVANIVAHEITHMWFGNLVTCHWWSDLWLNEGFARLYQYYLPALVIPELGWETRFVPEQMQSALFSDSVDTAHALTDDSVNDPAAVSAIFSTISYAKGASVIRMTQHLLGNDTFVKGLRQFIQERQFDVSEPDHLFSALDAAATEDQALTAYNGISITEYFKTWSEQAGYPLLTVLIDQRSGQMTVTQARWQRTTGVSTIPSLWQVPITWTRAGAIDFADTKPSQILTAAVTVISRGSQGNEWVIFNKQETGFYRVNYDDTNWALITRALRSAERTDIHVLNRGQIVDDLFALARAGTVPYNRAFNVLSFLEFEDQYEPWTSAISGLAFVLRRVSHDLDNLQKLQDEIVKLSSAATERLGYSEITGESYMDGLLRMDLLTFLCSIGHEQCVEAAKTAFESWLQEEYLPANMRPWVYCTGLREGNATDFDTFWARYLAEDLANEKVVMINAAGCTKDQASLNRYLDAIVAGDEQIRPQDHTTALNAAITGNEENTMMVFEWLKNNVDQTIATLGSASTPISNIASRLLNEEQIAEFQQWLDENQAIIGTASYDTGVAGIATARSNLAWSDERVGEIALYLETGYVEDEIEDIIEESSEEEEGEEEEDSSEDGSEDGGEDGGTEVDSGENSEEEGEPDAANIVALNVITLLFTVMLSLIAC